ncbi:hypothetical protein B0H14DRAFT_2577011 [Mycena olivaceomarginata]|nr:hypothetical protein B0H14DRAFT_2577011 [Mycena olivaceomarginata]
MDEVRRADGHMRHRELEGQMPALDNRDRVAGMSCIRLIVIGLLVACLSVTSDKSEQVPGPSIEDNDHLAHEREDASELPVVPGHFRQGYIVYTAFVVPSWIMRSTSNLPLASEAETWLSTQDTSNGSQILKPQNFKISRFSPQQNSRVEALRLANQVKSELKTQSAAKFKPHGSRLLNPQDLTGTVSPPDIKDSTNCTRHSLGQDCTSGHRGCGDTFQKVSDIINMMDTPPLSARDQSDDE